MDAYSAVEIYDLARLDGELLLMLLIAFGLGALFGRIVLAPQKRHSSTLALPAAQGLLHSAAEDDLKKIPGIGHKVEEALRTGGIRTFSELARASQERIHAILEKEGRSSAGTRSWPIMAALLASQKDHRS